jgi:hypothetical protein
MPDEMDESDMFYAKDVRSYDGESNLYHINSISYDKECETKVKDLTCHDKEIKSYNVESGICDDEEEIESYGKEFVSEDEELGSCDEPSNLPSHVIYCILEKCSIRTIQRLSTISDINHLCKKEDLMITKLVELFGQTKNSLVDADFKSKIKGKYSTEQWKKIFENYAPFIRWEGTPIFVDKLLHLNSKINHVVLARDGLMRVEIPGGFITYKNGEEIFTTPVQNLVEREDIYFTHNHIIARLPENGMKWSLADYSIDINMSIISRLPKLNEISFPIVDIVSNENCMVVLYSGGVLVYDWLQDKICKPIAIDQPMAKIIPEFLDNGRISRAILSDENKLNLIIINFFDRTSARANTGKSCICMVPIFDRNLIWTVDCDFVERSFSMVDGNIIHTHTGKFKDGVKKATYIESIQRIIIITNSGKAEVGEITQSGKYIKCGNFDYGLNNSFVINEIITGPSEVALVGKDIIRYISFSALIDDL